MHLIHTLTYELRRFVNSAERPHYAILPHVWGNEADELIFKEVSKQKEAAQERSGHAKLFEACKKAQEARCDWIWIDTCCIDKRSSAELQEAINCMSKWFGQSELCIVYLDDVDHIDGSNSAWNTRSPDELDVEGYEPEMTVRKYGTTVASDKMPQPQLDQFMKSVWFARSWTLQALTAPRHLNFFSRSRTLFGSESPWPAQSQL